MKKVSIMPDSTRLSFLVSIFLILSTLVAFAKKSVTAETQSKEWFGWRAKVQPLTLQGCKIIIHSVYKKDDLQGWIFRTDQTPPLCKGKRNEIATLVAIGTDKRIKGIKVISHKEDNKYFKKLSKSFFKQFEHLSVNTDTSKLDAVTKATRSSSAIIKDGQIVILNATNIWTKKMFHVTINPQQKSFKKLQKGKSNME
ncbi:MAG: FMN-binding protein, partial [Kiritimatiellae bacterium]|nr:FMN-binding protein [Kiritimatiellia bacterium]